MPIVLTKPLSWKNASHDEQRMLRALQGNILKGHGRSATVNIFFEIDAAKKHQMRAALREIANYHATSAYQQLIETDNFHAKGQSGTPFVSVFLSATGYAALGVAPGATPADPSFKTGMKAAALGDAPVASWDAPFQGQIDGMVLVGSENDTALRLKRDAVATLLTAGGGTVLKEQHGKAIFNQANNGIEHFGYVDGRSQPLLLVEDNDTEARDAGIAEWDPQASLDVALVPDPGSTDGLSFGSYFIFRKLDQNVRLFKRREQELATTLGFTGEARELAGAIVVGRFEDGTPVTMSDEAKATNPPNDFNYNADPGARCPFHAHIRKANPRGTGGFETPPNERKHLMVRRGIPYEDVPRLVHPSDLKGSETLAEFDAKVGPLLPTGDVGLLFMAYNHDLATQFEFTQKSWANSSAFPAGGPPPKLDPIIGQGPIAAQHWPKEWDNPAAGNAALSFQGFVKMRGGEYFFAPSLNFLKSL
ncbi:MAG: Dyp-type peroxidase [Gemmatimonadota bacterium]|nr:Dyp-type peroxidase [Gemmatimonadota bacterium]